MNDIKKKYGLLTSIAMVVGIVIGSGIFLKAAEVLESSGGNLKISLLAWLVGGLIMITSAFCFAIFATKITKFNGVIDYIEYTTTRKVGYTIAWIFTTLYYPIIASVVAIFASNYFLKIFGLSLELNHYLNYILAFGFITVIVLMNYFSPIIASKFQISVTIVKLIPVFFIVILGLFSSLIAGEGYGIVNAFSNNATGYDINFGDAIKKTAFAYEGWVCATAINTELKNSKRDLPRALIGGTVAVLVFYLIYYISVSAFLSNQGVISAKSDATIEVFKKVLGVAGSTIFTVFIMLSCLGTVNGVLISSSRGMYTMSCRNLGPNPKKFTYIKENRSMPLYSCLYGFFFTIVMLIIWYLTFNKVWLFTRLGSIDEILCAIIYMAYIFMYVYIMKNFKDKNVFVRFIMPILAIIGSLFFAICGSGVYELIAKGSFEGLINFAVFIGLLIIVTLPSIFFYRKQENISENATDQNLAI